jgi:transposase
VGKDLVMPSTVSLINLLPYSPELNPVENLWHYLRGHHGSNGVYPDYDTAHGPKSVTLPIDFRKSSRTIPEGKHPDPEETLRWISPSTT